MKKRSAVSPGLTMLGLLSAVMIGCGVEPAPESAPSLSTGEAGLNACQQSCADAFSACEWDCTQSNTGYECYEWCDSQYSICMMPSWTRTNLGKTICFLDKDDHVYEVEIEFYVADTYVDSTTCNPGTYYRKRRIDTVSCGPFSGEWSKSDCASKVSSRMQWWISQGYTPIVSEPGSDLCPMPGTF